MKITFLAPFHKISGGIRVVLTYADLLAKNGHEVTVVAQNRNWLRRNIANLLQLKPSWMKNLRAKVRRVASYQEANMPEADIVVISNWKDASVVAQYSPKRGDKFYLVQHDERMYHGERVKVDEAFRLPLKKIVVSTWLKEMFERDYGQAAELLLNNVDRKLFRPVKVARSDNSVRVLLLDHLYEWKGTREGVQIVQHLKEKYSNVKLILFGARRKNIDFSCDEYYYNLAQEKLAWLYSSCDIFLCPSWDEGFGLPSLEAMACQCAVVTYDNGGSRDFAFDPHTNSIRGTFNSNSENEAASPSVTGRPGNSNGIGVGVNGQTAFVAKRRDTVDLEIKLELAIKDVKLRREIVENAYQFVQKTPTWEEQADKLENIFEEAIKQNA